MSFDHRGVGHQEPTSLGGSSLCQDLKIIGLVKLLNKAAKRALMPVTFRGSPIQESHAKQLCHQAFVLLMALKYFILEIGN